jgi:CRISPR-associated protein Cas2
MIVLILERVSPSVRGELTRWLLEPKPGVFVGTVGARVRDRLWEKACRSLRGGAAVLIYTTNTEQGFAIRTAGETGRQIVEYEGLWLVCVPASPRGGPAKNEV